MTEETFLRSIVPAVAASRHGLAKVAVFQNLDELVTGIVDTLVGMNNGFGMHVTNASRLADVMTLFRCVASSCLQLPLAITEPTLGYNEEWHDLMEKIPIIIH